MTEQDNSKSGGGKKRERTVAILATNGFEQSELFEPLQALKDDGVSVHIVSDQKGSIRAWDEDEWGKSIGVDLTVDEAKAEAYDGLVLPGGLMSPDKLRMNRSAVEFVRSFFAAGKPVAAICHAPCLLIEAGVVDGRRLTSYESIKTDLQNAGAHWVNEEVVVDQGLTTSRSPDDLPAFNRKMLEELREGVHVEQRTRSGL